MGMDIMDLSFRLERTFGVLISNDDWMDLIEEDGDCTVRQVYDLLMQRQVQTEACRTSVTLNAEFWADFQSRIAAVRDVSVDELQLQTNLEDVFPVRSRFQDWHRLSEQTGYQLPQLGLPFSVINLFLVIAVLVAGGVLITWPLTTGPLLACLAMVLLVFVGTIRLSRPFRSRMPAGLRTLKDLCRTVRNQNLGLLAYQPKAGMPSAYACRELKRCMVEAIGVGDDEIMMDARLVADLGCG